MSLPELIMFGIVLAVGFPSAWRNLTAAALVGAYLVSQGLWALGVVLDYSEMFMIDIAVIALIACKTVRACRELEYRSPWHQARCLFTDNSLADRLILASFPLGVWPAYLLNVSDFARWWMLWTIALAQLLAAGAEAYSEWRPAKAPVSVPDTPSSGSLRAAWAGADRWPT